MSESVPDPPDNFCTLMQLSAQEPQNLQDYYDLTTIVLLIVWVPDVQ